MILLLRLKVNGGMIMDSITRTRPVKVLQQLKLIGHTKSSFCKSIGIGRMTFDRYLNGENMNTKTVDKIEEGLYDSSKM